MSYTTISVRTIATSGSSMVGASITRAAYISTTTGATTHHGAIIGRTMEGERSGSTCAITRSAGSSNAIAMDCAGTQPGGLGMCTGVTMTRPTISPTDGACFNGLTARFD